jgi:hypothetical protein
MYEYPWDKSSTRMRRPNTSFPPLRRRLVRRRNICVGPPPAKAMTANVAKTTRIKYDYVRSTNNLWRTLALNAMLAAHGWCIEFPHLALAGRARRRRRRLLACLRNLSKPLFALGVSRWLNGSTYWRLPHGYSVSQNSQRPPLTPMVMNTARGRPWKRQHD